MSFRSSARLATRLAAQRFPTSTQVIGRRAASTASASAPKKGGDTMWMIGSVAVFGSLGAFLLLPSGDKAHEAAHGSNRERAVEASEGAPGAIPGVDAVQHVSVDDKTEDDPKKVHPLADKYPGTIPAKQHSAKMNEYPGHDNDNSGGTQGSTMFSSDRSPEEQKAVDANKSDGPGKVDGSSIPSTEDMKDRASDMKDRAMDMKDSVMETAKSKMPSLGMSSGASKRSSDSSSDSETPSNVDESGAPSAKEIEDSIRQAEKSNAPEVAWNEESK